MAKACSIFRNNDGSVKTVIASNGQESKLYNDILVHPMIKGNEELAVNMYLLAYTPSFKNYFGDFEIGEARGPIDQNDEPFVGSLIRYMQSEKPPTKQEVKKEDIYEAKPSQLVKSKNKYANELRSFYTEGFEKRPDHKSWYVKDHLDVVQNIVDDLHTKYGGDKNILDLMVYTHDLAKAMNNETKSHRETIEPVLKKMGIANDVINTVISNVEMMDRVKKEDVADIPIEVKILSTADALSHYTTGDRGFLNIFSNQTSDADMESIKKSNEQKLAKDKRKILLPEFNLNNTKISYDDRKTSVSGSVTDYLNSLQVEGFKKFVNEQAPDIYEVKSSPIGSKENLEYQFKATENIISNLDKVSKWIKQLGFSDQFWNKVQQDLQIPKDQIALLRDVEGNTIEEKLASFAANYGYTVEINLSKAKQEPAYYNEDTGRLEGGMYERPSDYYSNLTVPGGTNYTENEIATPAIVPSIKGHAQFATENGIGWFRSDDQVLGIKTRKALPQEIEAIKELEGFAAARELEKNGYPDTGGNITKTRRILEMQSDLFQKGREQQLLVDMGSITNLDQVRFIYNGDVYESDGGKDFLKNGKSISIEEFEKAGEKKDKEDIKVKENQFLQLLNKANNWVTFFAKSIIQDSAKKGYEKVLFPKGDTASKIEGHTTLEQFKKEKEDRIKELEKEKKRYNFESLPTELKTKENQTEYDLQISSKNNEITQLKQELERVEKEGFAALRPIYNFYENTLGNVLKKQGYNPKVITDEYGNQWYQVKIEQERDKKPVLFQKEGIPTDMPEIDIADVSKVLNRLKGIFSIEFEIVNEPNSDWKGKYENGKVYINSAKKITKDTAFHEYLHPFVLALKKENRALYDKLVKDLQSLKEGKDEIDMIKSLADYANQSEEENIDEALVSYLGKLAAGNINDKGEVIGQEKTKRSMIDQFTEWLRNLLQKVFSVKVKDISLNNSLQDIANMVSKSNAKIKMGGVSSGPLFQYSQEVLKFRESVLKSGNDLQKKIIQDVMPEQDSADGRVVLEEKTHTYRNTKTGQVYKSVTTAIKGELNDPEGLYELNRLFGNQFDRTLQDIIMGKTFEEAKLAMTGIISEEISKRAYESLKAYFTGVTADGSIILPQVILADHESGIAGSLDIFIIKPDGKVIIADLKVSKNSYRSSNYRTKKYDVHEGSIFQGERLTTEQQHGIQVGTYKKLAEVNGYPVDGIQTVHILLDVDNKKRDLQFKKQSEVTNYVLKATGEKRSQEEIAQGVTEIEKRYDDEIAKITGQAQIVKDFEWEGIQSHNPESNQTYVDRIVPTKSSQNKIEGYKKELGIHNPANDPSFLTADEALPEPTLGKDELDRLQFTVDIYVDKLRQRLEYYKNLSEKKFSPEYTKEATIDKLSELLSKIETIDPGKPNVSFGRLLNYAKDRLDEMYRYMNNPTNVNAKEYIEVVLEAEKFVESFRDIASIPEMGLGSAAQFKLMRDVQSRLNAVKSEVNPALEEYVKNLIRGRVNYQITEEELDGLLKEGFDISLDQLALSDMQNTKERILAIAANLYMEANQKAMNRSQEFEEMIKHAGNKLGKVLGGGKIDFSFMLHFDENGKFSGRYVEAIGSKYYKLKKEMFALVKDEDGEMMQYRVVKDLINANPDDILHNIDLQKKKEKLREFTQAEMIDSTGKVVSGNYHRYSNEFVQERAKYEMLDGNALSYGIIVWKQRLDVSDEEYRKFKNKYYDRVEYVGALVEKGVYKGKAEEKIAYFPKKEFVEIKEITSDGKDMRDDKYIALVNPRTEADRAKKEFYEVFMKAMKSKLEVLPLDVQQQMLGQVARVKNNYLNSAKKKGPSFFKAITGRVKDFFDISPKMHSMQRITDDEGVPVDNLPILYTNNARNEKKIETLKEKIKDLKDSYIVKKSISSDEYESELKKLELSLAIENGKIDFDEINLDLVENLIAFGRMADKYEQMSNIEGALLALFKTVEKKKYYQSNSTEEKFVKKGINKGVLYKKEGDSLAYTRFKKWFKMVYYNNDEYDYSAFAQVASRIQNMTSLKGMGFNLFGGINNYVMGRINNSIESYGGVYYTRKAYSRATKAFNREHVPGMMKNLGRKEADIYNIERSHSKYEALVSRFRMVRKFQSDSGRVDMFSKAYMFAEAGEYNVQSKTGIAVLMDSKFELTNSKTGEKLNIYDAYDYNEQTDELKLKDGFELSEEDAIKVTNYIYEVNKQIHGNYAWEDRMVIQSHALGQLGAQFHKWVYPAYRARFQKRYDNEVLGTIEGRYRTFWNVMKHVYKTEEGFLNKTTGLLGMFIPGSRTFKQMDETQVKNMYKNLAELGFFLGSFLMAHLFMLIKAGAGDDDERVKKLLNFLIYQQTRQMNEIKTMIPVVGWSEAYQMAKSPIAAVGTIKEYGEVATALLGAPFPPYDKNYYERGPFKGDLKLWKQAKDVIPALGILNRWESFETVSNFYIK